MPKKINAEDKENFLKLFGDNKNYYSIRESCKKAKIGKSTFYRWLKHPEFKETIDRIKEKRGKDPMRQAKKGNFLAHTKIILKTMRLLQKGDYATASKMIKLSKKYERTLKRC